MLRQWAQELSGCDERHEANVDCGGQRDLIFALMAIRMAPELGNTRVVTVVTGATVEPRARDAADNSDDWKARWIDIPGTIHGTEATKQ